jgi:hypothetical protein
LLRLAPRHIQAVEAVDRRGRGDLLDRATKPPGEIDMKWVLSSRTATDLTYELAFNVGASEDFPDTFYITRERLRFAEPAKGKEAPFRFIDCHTKAPGKGEFSVKDRHGKSKLHAMEVSSGETVFRQLKTLLKDKRFYTDLYPRFEETADFVRTYFEGFHAYSSAEIDPRSVVAGAKRDLTVRTLDRAGEQLVNVLRYVEQQPEGLDAYTSRLRELMPARCPDGSERGACGLYVQQEDQRASHAPADPARGGRPTLHDTL